MTDELRNFLKSNQDLLKKNDFQKLITQAERNKLGPELLEFLYNAANIDVLKFIHNIVHKEGQEVQHATQFIIYFISWGLIFLLYLLKILFFDYYYQVLIYPPKHLNISGFLSYYYFLN